jgi:hypothetical protein
MGEAEEKFETGLRLMQEGNFYDAMTNFTSSYNISGNSKSLFYSAEATFQMAMFYFKGGSGSGWGSFADSAMSKFDLCVKYAETEQLRNEAALRIAKIKEMKEMAKGLL